MSPSGRREWVNKNENQNKKQQQLVNLIGSCNLLEVEKALILEQLTNIAVNKCSCTIQESTTGTKVSRLWHFYHSFDLIHSFPRNLPTSHNLWLITLVLAPFFTHRLLNLDDESTKKMKLDFGAFSDPEINRVLDVSSIPEKLSICRKRIHDDVSILRLLPNSCGKWQELYPNIQVKRVDSIVFEMIWKDFVMIKKSFSFQKLARRRF